MEPKEISKETEKEAVPNLILSEESKEDVCWDKPITLSGGCCQD